MWEGRVAGGGAGARLIKGISNDRGSNQRPRDALARRRQESPILSVQPRRFAQHAARRPPETARRKTEVCLFFALRTCKMLPFPGEWDMVSLMWRANIRRLRARLNDGADQ